jgi:prepilin-type processing-associated H-X9-DG protein
MTAVLSAQESGRLANCKSNLKQLYALFLQYTSTYGGFLPALYHERWIGEMELVGRRWGDLHDDLRDDPAFGGLRIPAVWNNNTPMENWTALPRDSHPMLIRSGAPVLICKSDTTLYRTDQGCLSSYLGLAKYGWWWRDGPLFEYHQITEYDNHSARLLLLESEPGTWQFESAVGNCGCRWHAYSQPLYIVQRHFSGGNILFFDGHIELARPPKLLIEDWEPGYRKTVPEGWAEN